MMSRYDDLVEQTECDRVSLEEKLKNLLAQVGHLEEVVSAMSHRLRPILPPDLPSNGAVKESPLGKELQVMSPVSQSIRMLGIRLDDVIGRLNHMINEAEL